MCVFYLLIFLEKIMQINCPPFSVELTNWLNTLLEDYKNRIYPINLAVAENWGVIRGNAEKEDKPMSSIDSLIASIAYTYNLILATRNENDFKAANLPIQNQWAQ